MDTLVSFYAPFEITNGAFTIAGDGIAQLDNFIVMELAVGELPCHVLLVVPEHIIINIFLYLGSGER
jgi:hypothetical protein